ncbi:MAG: hypothetical protein E7774_16785 [Bradyrhizobium sp.]|nr:MAG: hypothetical protein E7774_16785 [Bradyrhizobium sp.]
MASWPRSPRLLKLFVGQHIVNGLSVALCVLAVTILASALFGFAAGQPATLGAIAASISDFPAPWRPKGRIMIVGFALAIVSTSAILLAGAGTPAGVVVVGLVAFAAGMVTAYGRWALSLSAQLVVPMVFVIGLPAAGPAQTLDAELLLIGGGAVYIVLSLVATLLTDRGDRRMMASECFRELGAYLSAVARFTDPSADLAETYGAAISQQTALATQLQAARGLLLERPRRTPERIRLAATIGVLLDGFDALVAAQCDLPRLREWPVAATLMKRIGVALRAAAYDLQQLSLELLTNPKPHLPPGHTVATEAMRREAARLAESDELDAEQKAAVEATVARLLDSRRHVARLERAVCDDAVAAAAIGEVDLSVFAPRRSYHLRHVGAQFTLESPVFRYAIRLTAAMVAGAIVARSFGDAAHGNWVLLTIAVIMRASYGWTRKRRDDRIAGTLIGCVIAAIAVATLPTGALVVVQVLALALTHGFVRSHYRIASIGASVMALASLHLVNPAETGSVIARLADTLVGAAIAHLFSHILPRWEFVEARRLVARLMAQIGAFAAVALQTDGVDQDYRLARKELIEAIAALADSAARMGGEPRAARRGLDQMPPMLMAAYVVVANLAAMRLALRVADPESAAKARAEAEAARDWLNDALAQGAHARGPGPAEPNERAAALKNAVRNLVTAANVYRDAAASPSLLTRSADI